MYLLIVYNMHNISWTGCMCKFKNSETTDVKYRKCGRKHTAVVETRIKDKYCKIVVFAAQKMLYKIKFY